MTVVVSEYCISILEDFLLLSLICNTLILLVDFCERESENEEENGKEEVEEETDEQKFERLLGVSVPAPEEEKMRTRSQKGEILDKKEGETVPENTGNDSIIALLRAQKITLPYRILQHTDEAFAGTVMTVAIVLPGGTQQKDLLKVKVNIVLIFYFSFYHN